MVGIKLWLSCRPVFAVAFLAIALLPSCSFAQAADGGLAESGPIYLEEPEEEPPARPAKRKTLKEIYEDKSTRAERAVVMMSDDTVVSDGLYTEYYPDGQKYVEGKYKMGIFDGEWNYWYPSGQLCKTITFKAGKPDGQWEVIGKDGKRAAQKSYEKGKRQGKWITYFPEGEQAKIEIDYKQGQIDGQRSTYFKNGQKRQEINFKNGKMHGMMTEWNEDGQKSAEALFNEGMRDGKVVQFGNIPGVGEKKVGALSSKLKKKDDELVPLNKSDDLIELNEEE